MDKWSWGSSDAQKSLHFFSFSLKFLDGSAMADFWEWVKLRVRLGFSFPFLVELDVGMMVDNLFWIEMYR